MCVDGTVHVNLINKVTQYNTLLYVTSEWQLVGSQQVFSVNQTLTNQTQNQRLQKERSNELKASDLNYNGTCG